MSKRTNNHLYFGKAGHLFIMSELLLQKWNVAMPEVDIGDDIFVVRDENNAFLKVQVKSANVKRKGNQDIAIFSTSISQLRSEVGTLIYFFVLRFRDKWKPIIIERNQLEELHDRMEVGGKPNKNRRTLILNFALVNGRPFCDGFSFSRYVNDWSEFEKHKTKKL